jgi:hypothetical protein
MENELIIEIKYSGLGDHLFHSHLPRIAKETKRYDKVYISNHSLFGHPDYKTLIWDLNPFVDGFTDLHGVSCDIGHLVKRVSRTSEKNLLDEIMLFYGLDNDLTWNQPEVYYKPRFREEYNFTIYDPNFVSWIGNVIDEDAAIFFRKKNIRFDYVMKLRNKKVLFIPDSKTRFIETPTLQDFCDLIFSCKRLYCLTSGTATLAAALKKTATVFYGTQQEDGFKHNKKHEYVLIPRNLSNRIVRVIKRFLKPTGKL